MQAICPKCNSPLATEDGINAYCAVDGAQYQVLYSREPMLVQDPQPVLPMREDYFTAEDVAPTAPPLPPPLPEPTGAYEVQAPPQAAEWKPVESWDTPAQDVVVCSMHPQIAAVAYCNRCRLAACETCNFSFPNGMNLCAACASIAPVVMTPVRKQLMGWSFAMAGVTVLGVVLTALSHDDGNPIAFLIVLLLFVFAPTTIGAALGWAALDKRLGNPVPVWIAAIWNTVVIAALLFTALSRIMMQLG